MVAVVAAARVRVRVVLIAPAVNAGGKTFVGVGRGIVSCTTSNQGSTGSKDANQCASDCAGNSSCAAFTVSGDGCTMHSSADTCTKASERGGAGGGRMCTRCCAGKREGNAGNRESPTQWQAGSTTYWMESPEAIKGLAGA